MTVITHLLAGIIGGFFSIIPVGFDSYIYFWNSVNETIAGKNNSMFGFDVVSLIYLGAFLGLFFIYRNRFLAILKKASKLKYIKNGIQDDLTETFEVCATVIIWFVFSIIACFLENAVLISIFLCLTILISYIVDFIKPMTLDRKKLFIFSGCMIALSAFVGFSEISVLFLLGIVKGKKASNAINYTFLCSIPMYFIKFIVYFVKALIFGFSLNFWFVLPIIALAFISSFFAVSVTKKAALKKNFKYFSYYTLVFTIVFIHTFLKG